MKFYFMKVKNKQNLFISQNKKLGSKVILEAILN